MTPSSLSKLVLSKTGTKCQNLNIINSSQVESNDHDLPFVEMILEMRCESLANYHKSQVMLEYKRRHKLEMIYQQWWSYPIPLTIHPSNQFSSPFLSHALFLPILCLLSSSSSYSQPHVFSSICCNSKYRPLSVLLKTRFHNFKNKSSV